MVTPALGNSPVLAVQLPQQHQPPGALRARTATAGRQQGLEPAAPPCTARRRRPPDVRLFGSVSTRPAQPRPVRSAGGAGRAPGRVVLAAGR